MDVVQRMWFIENIENNPRQAGAIISSNAKEKQRKAMEAWSYEVRHQDPGRFCRISCGRGVDIIFLVGFPIFILSTFQLR